MAQTQAEVFTGEFREVGDIVGTTLGPLGTTKLFIQEDGTVETTADGAEILDMVDTDDPAIALLESGLEQFRETTGDGIRTLIVVSEALVSQALELRSMGLHPRSIVDGYDRALSVAVDRLAESGPPLESVGLAPVVTSALTDVRDPRFREHLATQLVETVERIDADGTVRPTDITVVSRLGDPLSETELVEGVVLDQDPILETMPRRAGDAGIAVLSETVDVQTITETNGPLDPENVTLRCESYDEVAEVREWEQDSFERAVADATAAGCRVLITSRAVNDRVKTTLANEGVLAVQRVDETELKRTARAVGGTPIPRLADVSPETLGRGDVNVQRKAGEDMTIVRSGTDSDVYTLLCRSPDERSLESFERSVESALGALLAVTETGEGVVAGGGGAEIDAAKAVTRAARSVDDDRSLAMESFGEALRAVPARIAANAGMDTSGTIARLRNHAGGEARYGVDSEERTVRDVISERPVVDAASVKRRVWNASTELATQLIRVDDVLAARDLGEETDA